MKQSIPLADFIDKTADSFHEMNNVKELLVDIDDLYMKYKEDKLPVSRDEFEYRAVLFHFKRIRIFLQIKRNFILELEKDE